MTKISYVSWVNDKAKYQGFKDSVPKAAGIVREFIEVGQEFDSMAKAYNEGMRRSTGDVFCFVHQDVRIFTHDFEEQLDYALHSEDVGFVGVIGSVGIPNPSWWDVPQLCKHGSIVQGDGKSNRFNLVSYSQGSCLVNNLDGLLMATKQKDFIWPEEFPGIHFVDLAACRMMENAGFDNYILPVLVQHLSQGENTSQSFQNNRRIYESKFIG